MLDIKAVIRHFGPQSISILLKQEEFDTKALQAVKDSSASDRVYVILGWLQSYKVFQGIPGPQRTAIAEAILRYADLPRQRGGLATEDDLCQAHKSLLEECVEAYGKERDFTSLASKALWLCYPDDVPLFDNFARRALWVFAKMESGITPLADTEPEFRQFVHIWKSLYARYKDTIDEIDMHAYPHTVRVFDVILWIVGSPEYKVSLESLKD